MSTPASKALAAVGRGQDSGMCERFTRGCFGFPARYGSARLAYIASASAGKLHADMSPPPGVPVFWDILTGPNARYDHVAVSVGGGYVVSTSAGPGRTVAKVKIADLTRRWGMRYLGWAEVYHGHRVYAPTVSDTAYPSEPVGTDLDALESAWYRLLGALGYAGSTATRLQEWLRRSGDYTGLVDGDWGRLTTAALQRRLARSHATDSTGRLLDPGPADAVRGTRTRAAEAAYLNAHAWRAK